MTIKELLQRLRQPLPANVISHKDTGKYTADFVNITDLKDLLDERLGCENWETSLRELYQFNESLVMILQLTIHGDDASRSHVGTGIEHAAVGGYGDPASNAYAQALRRAAESFGLGRELWRGEDHSVGQRSQPQANAPRQEQRNSDPQAPSGVSKGFAPPSRPDDPVAKSVSEVATPKQLVMAKAICRDLGDDIDSHLEEIWPGTNFKLEEMTRKAVSFLIDHLKKLQEGGAPQPAPKAQAAPQRGKNQPDDPFGDMDEPPF